MIVCNRSALAGFKIRAGRAWPKEYLELLFGYIENGIRYVTHFERVKQIATRSSVRPRFSSDDKYEEFLADKEQELGLDWLGTIHTHPYACDPDVPSDADNNGAINHGEQIFAIDWIIKRGTAGRRLTHEIRWYEPQLPIQEVALV